MKRHISYLRVSTERQGRSGLGLEAQRRSVEDYLKAHDGDLAGEYQEAESGKNNDRPALKAALDECRQTGAVLIVAKLDRLARDTAFLLKVIEGVGEGGVVFCDLPQLPAGPSGRFVLTLFAAVAELERGMISQRTKAALASAKARGVKLGNPENLPASNPETALRATQAAQDRAQKHAARVMPYIEDARRAGADTHHKLAEALQARGVKTARGKSAWTPTQVSRVMARAI